MASTHSISLARPGRALAGLVAAAAMLLGIAGPAAADNTVTQSVVAGARTATVSGVAFGSDASREGDDSISGTLVLIVDDSSGTGAGWDVTMQSSAFTHTGSGSDATIPAANLLIGAASAPIATAGQAVDRRDGPRAGIGGSLGLPRLVLHANPDHGLGTYIQAIPITVQVPTGTPQGTYTSTLTTVIAPSRGSSELEAQPVYEQTELVIEVIEAESGHPSALAHVAGAGQMPIDSSARGAVVPIAIARGSATGLWQI